MSTRLSNLDSLSVELTASRSFGGSRIASDFRNFAGSTSYSRTISPRSTAGFRFSVSRADYSGALASDSSTINPQLTYSMQFGPRFNVNAALGYMDHQIGRRPTQFHRSVRKSERLPRQRTRIRSACSPAAMPTRRHWRRQEAAGRGFQLFLSARPVRHRRNLVSYTKYDGRRQHQRPRPRPPRPRRRELVGQSHLGNPSDQSNFRRNQLFGEKSVERYPILKS